MSADEIKDELVQIDPQFQNLIDIWKNTGLGRLQLTSVGIALAHANIKNIIGVELDLGIWIR